MYNFTLYTVLSGVFGKTSANFRVAWTNVC